MSTSGTPTTTYSFQKGGGSMAVSSAVTLGNTIVSNEATPQNLSLGQSVPRTPKLVTPVTGSEEVFRARATMVEDDNEVYTFFFPAAATCADGHLMIANYNYIVHEVKCKFAAASTSGTFDIKVCDNAEAISAGQTVLASTVSIAGSADTNTSGTLATDPSNRIVNPGQSIAIDFGGTLTNIAGLTVTLVLRRLIAPARLASNYIE